MNPKFLKKFPPQIRPICNPTIATIILIIQAISRKFYITTIGINQRIIKKNNDSESVTKCNRLKMVAKDEKIRPTDAGIIPTTGYSLLIKGCL